MPEHHQAPGRNGQFAPAALVVQDRVQEGRIGGREKRLDTTRVNAIEIGGALSASRRRKEFRPDPGLDRMPAAGAVFGRSVPVIPGPGHGSAWCLDELGAHEDELGFSGVREDGFDVEGAAFEQ